MTPDGADTFSGGPGLTTNCYPPYFFQEELSVDGSGVTKTPVSVGFYSPGICPKSYATVLQQVDGSGQTSAICCPGSLSLSTTVLSNSDFYRCGGAINYVSGSSTDTVDVFELVQAPAITIVNGPGDSTLFITSTPSTDTTTAAPSRPSASAAIATSSTAPQPSGLTTSAQAGIGVGVTLGVIVIFLIAFLIWRNKKSKKPSNPQQESETTFDKAELSGQGKDIPELDRGTAVYEANGVTKPPEMATDTVLAELDGSWRGWEAPDTGRR